MVDRCVCYNKTFEFLQQIAVKNNVTNSNKLHEFVQFGENCKLCIPYIELMLKTGKVEFEIIIPDNVSK